MCSIDSDIRCLHPSLSVQRRVPVYMHTQLTVYKGLIMHIVNARIRSATASKLPRVVAPAVDINNQCVSYVLLV
jgi:hypothetical protein